MATKGGAAAAAYPSAARISDSPCYHQYSASLKCESRSRLNHVTARRIVTRFLPLLIRVQIYDLDYLITWDKFHNETLRS